MKISNRIQSLPYSSIRKLTPFAEEAKSKGKKVYHLNIGAPDVETPEEFFESIRNVEIETLTYAPSRGIPELVKATSDYYKRNGIDFDECDLAVTSGGSEALLFTLLLIADHGEEILTCEPYYANYTSLFYETGVKVNTFPTLVDNGFRLPEREVIEKYITEKTRALLISNPGNPTGTIYTEEELNMLADIAIDHDLYIISDEVYREFIFDGAQYLSFAKIEKVKDRVIIIDSISKRFSACGARIGTIGSKNQEVVAAAVKLCTGRLAAPTLEQIGAAALYELDEKYFDKVKEEYEKRRDCIYEELTSIPGVKTYKSAGAFYTMAELPVESAEDFATWLLKDFDVDGETLMMAPAYGFYQNVEKGKSQVRLAFVLNCEAIKKAMNILKLGLEEYNK